MGIIYKIYNDINDKVYIGKTLGTIEKRFKEHIKDSKKVTNEKRPLYNAMNKYGIDNFHISIIENNVNVEILSERENYWIQYYDSYNNGYNATLGGDGKILYNYKEIADKYKELQNEKMVAEYFQCDTFTVRVACKENNVKILTPAEMSKKNCSKKIAQLDKDTEEILNVFNSVSEAFRFLNKTKSGGIAKACNENKVYIGYKWKYI